MKKNYKKLLLELLTKHFYLEDNKLIWNYIEDTSIGEVDKELEDKLKEILTDK